METTKATPKFLVACNCDEIYVCTDEHVEPGVVAAKCSECDGVAAVQFGDSFLCEAHAHPCWKCEGIGCRACGDSGSEAQRRALQNCAVLPAFDPQAAELAKRIAGPAFEDEPTRDIPVEPMAKLAVRR